jgi:hypothetical protein
MNLRVRLTVDGGIWRRAVVYAADTNRTPAELVDEALEQIMARYPRRRQAAETDVEALAAKVAEILATRVPAGTSTGEGAGG